MKTTPDRIDTGSLKFLRPLLAQIPALRMYTGEIPRFRIVIDACEMVHALLYHLKYPERGPPLLNELIRADLLEVHAPRWLETEMHSAIPQAAESSGFSEGALWDIFETYRPKLLWDETLRTAGSSGCDPKDVPYIVLAEKIAAVGIFTNDPDIAKLGGHPLSIGFIVATKDYARSAAKSISYRIASVLIPGVTLLTVVGTAVGIVNLFMRMPPGVQATIIAALGVALAIPKSRRWLMDFAGMLVSLARDVAPELMRGILDLAAAAEAEKPITDATLAKATQLTQRPRRRLKPAAAARRVATRKPVTISGTAQPR
jgi:hypothetical protein